MYIRCEIPVTTSLYNANVSITEKDDYLDYLQEQIFAEEPPKLRTVFYSEEYGNAAFTFYLKDSYLFGHLDKVIIYASSEIRCEDKYPEESKLLEALERDSKFWKFIEESVSKFVEEFNSFASNVKHPKNVDFIFEDNRILLEVSPYTVIQNPEWVSFSLDNVVYSRDVDIYTTDVSSFYRS